MRVTMQYFAQIRQAAGSDTLALDVPEAGTLKHAVQAAVERHGDAFRNLVVDEAGRLRPSVLTLVNGEVAAAGPDTVLRDKDVVSLFSPLAGG